MRTWRETTKLASSDWEWHGRNLGASVQLLLKPGQFDRCWPFMTSPRPECTCAELKKRQVWPNGDSSTAPTQLGGVKIPPPGGLQSAQGRRLFLICEIISPFYIFTFYSPA